MPDIQRFIKAQQGNTSSPSYAQAYGEIKSGRKKDHWIWYIFPQLEALGHSSTAKYYGIVDLKETCDYLKNPKLFKNYLEISQLVLQQLKNKIPIRTLMNGDTDARKLTSSLTLFREASSFLLSQGNTTQDFAKLVTCCDEIFNKIAQQGYSPCERTHTIIEEAIKNTVPRRQYTEISSMEGYPHDFSGLDRDLDSYINQRESEWDYHYNFLGFVSVIYWLQDLITGTDHFNNKSRETKINAATKLKNIINNTDESLSLTTAEKQALADGRLGNIVKGYGAVDNILQTIEDEKLKTVGRNNTL